MRLSKSDVKAFYRGGYTVANLVQHARLALCPAYLAEIEAAVARTPRMRPSTVQRWAHRVLELARRQPC